MILQSCWRTAIVAKCGRAAPEPFRSSEQPFGRFGAEGQDHLETSDSSTEVLKTSNHPEPDHVAFCGIDGANEPLRIALGRTTIHQRGDMTRAMSAIPHPRNVEQVQTVVECAVAGIAVTFRLPRRWTPVAMIRVLADIGRQLAVAGRSHKHGRA
jgi:hypothetical protein